MSRPKDKIQRVAVGFRVTPETKKRLNLAASKNGRSISQEAEMRLAQSFRDHWIIDQMRKLLEQ
jgi:riboflavin synthase alpha subunit